MTSKTFHLPFFLTLAMINPGSAASGSTPNHLPIVQNGKAEAAVLVAEDAGPWERRAADDLVKYIEKMSRARPRRLTLTRGVPAPEGPALLVGRAALEADAGLKAKLAAVAKKNPSVRADAIVMRRRGNRIYLAGSNDESHYFAVSRILQDWGCRWYLPTEFGECIPERPTLTVGTLDRAYAPPFEIRHYWLSWNADATGADEFRRRNFMTETSMAGMGHALGKYTERLVPPGKTVFHVPLAEAATAQEVAARIEPEYERGVEGISLAIEDGNYTSESVRDRALQAGIFDKYTLQPSNTDAMMTLYNRVAGILREKHPSSRTKIGGMAYANVTLPPQQVTSVEPNVVMWLAPIDIDPNHGMDDVNSPPRREYREMMYRWAELMKGRLAIYDYDQGQLVWRDLPNPSHHAFAQDVKHYRKAGILGVGTESRGAIVTTFLNLFFRGQLMWNPDVDVKALLAEFYPNFYGPAAAPMAEYWNAMFEAWEKTLSTEHEYFIAPVIYTPELIAFLRERLALAKNRIVPRAKAKPLHRNDKLYRERMQFTQLSFEVLESYMAMVRAAGGTDYRAAVADGERGLAAREKLTAMNPTFTTYKNIGEQGPSWWPGEVAQMRDLLALTDGSRGTLVAKTPLEWAFRRDPRDTGLPRGWAYQEADLAFWKARGAGFIPESRKDYPDEWEMLRTDLYIQGQGVRHPDRQSYTGHYWYQTSLDLKPEQTAGTVRLMFPGLFNECWLYVNGKLVAHRPYTEPWWRNDYRFEWDVNLTGKLKAGRNSITLRGYNPHHFGGMFRRPFLYRAVKPSPATYMDGSPGKD